MNFSQVSGILRILSPAVIGILAQQHMITDNSAANWSVLILSVLGSAALSGNANTTLNLSKAVAAVPGLQVHVDKFAPSEMLNAANNHSDPTVADIVPAAPAQMVSSTITQKRGF
jgi:hypothetical protein